MHEVISLDGVIDAPTWTFDYGYDPAMGPDIGGLMSGCEAILLGRMVRSLMADDLIDELHLFLYPLTRGAGPRLFPPDPPTKWTLDRSVAYNNGVLYLAYQAAAG